jgi:hypothetical protein
VEIHSFSKVKVAMICDNQQVKSNSSSSSKAIENDTQTMDGEATLHNTFSALSLSLSLSVCPLCSPCSPALSFPPVVLTLPWRPVVVVVVGGVMAGVRRIAKFYLKFLTGTRKNPVRLRFGIQLQINQNGAAQTVTVESNSSRPFIVITNECQWEESEGILLKKDAFGEQVPAHQTPQHIAAFNLAFVGGPRPR